MGGQVGCAAIATTCLDRHAHAATTETQIEQLGHRQLVFADHVVAHHAELGLAVGHINGHIGIAHQQGPGLTAGAGHHQLAVAGLK